MKKIMTALLCALGFSLASQANSISGTNFEDLSVGFEVIGKTDDGSIDGGYWSNTVESVEALVATNTFTMVEVPPQEEEGDPTYEPVPDIAPYTGTVGFPTVHDEAQTSEKFLSINTKGGELVRNIQEGGTAQSIGNGIYFDSMVQFTATDALDAGAGNADDKLIIWLREENGTTNLVVTAGYLNDEYNAVSTNYVTTANVQADKWYRLTIQAITNAINDSENAYTCYAIYIDGVKAEYETTFEAFDSTSTYEVQRPYDGYLYNESVHALFPSLLGSSNLASQFTAVAFSGVGAVDDIEFTSDAPEFTNPPASLTVNWTVGIATVTITPAEGDAIVIAANGEAGSTNILERGSYTIAATAQAGYVGATVSDDDVEVVNSDVVVEVSTSLGYAQIGDTLYASLADAIAAVAANGTVKLSLGNDLGANALEVNSANAFVLDLNGKILSGADGAVVMVGSAMTIIDSVGGGAISNTTENAAVVVDGGSLVIGFAENDMGATFFGMVGPNGEESFSIVRGNFYSDNAETIGGFVAQGSVGNDIEGCYVVAPDTGVKVAQIGETTYETLAEAVAAAANGDTVTLLDNITLDARVEPNVGANTAITIDLGGFTLTRTGTSGNGSVFDVKSGNVVITNGVIDCTQDDTDIAEDGVYAITSRSGSNVTLADLTITVDSECGACAYPFAGSTMTIESGTYANVTTTPYRYNTAITGMAVNQPNNATQNLIIRGGSFSKYDPQLGDDSGNMTDFTAAGFVAIQDGSGNWVVQPGYNVTFDVAGGSPAPAAQRVAVGNKATAPAEEPTKEGYTFTGWFASGAETAFDFNTVLDGDLVLTAAWEQSTPAAPVVDDKTVVPGEEFNTATTEKPITYPSTPTVTGEVGNQTITYGTSGSVKVPEYYTAAVEGNTVNLTLNDNALATIGDATVAEEAKQAIEIGGETVGVTLTTTNPKLYYGVQTCSTPDGTFTLQGTPQQGTGSAMQLSVTRGENESAKFYRLYVTDVVAPAQN